MTDTSASATVAYTFSRIVASIHARSTKRCLVSKFRTIGKIDESKRGQLEKSRHTREQRLVIVEDLPTMIKQLTSIIRILTALCSWEQVLSWRMRLGFEGALGRWPSNVTPVPVLDRGGTWSWSWSWSRSRSWSRSQVASVVAPPPVVGRWPRRTRGVARDDEAARISDDGETPRKKGRSSSSVTGRSVSWSTTSMVVQPTAKVHAVAVQGHTWRGPEQSRRKSAA